MSTRLKSGYKQTEVGVIPEEWQVKEFASVAALERGKFTARPRNDPKFYGGDIPFIQTGDVTNSSGEIRTYSQTLNADGLKVSKLFPRETLFFTIAANIGDIGITSFETACPDSLVAVTPHGRVNKRWLFQELKRRKKSFESLATQNAQLNINLEKLRPYLIPVPPFSEQCAIAEALGDVDALLDALTQLIAKKRDLKQAAMQQLLTGKHRLPGFSGAWDVLAFGDLFQITAGGDVDPARSKSYRDETYHYPIYSNALEHSGLYGFCSYAEHQSGSITITARGTLGAANYRDHPYTAIGRVLVLRPKGNMDGRFFAEVINNRIKFAIESTGVPQLTAPQISTYRLPFPSLNEQIAIGDVLTDMDAEIVALEQRLAKAQALKQGMMHELLTGRTRLV